jgi:hypothetical protein
MRRTSTAFLTVAALGLLPAQASAQQATMHVKPKSVHAGERVRVFGSAGGCMPGDSVTLISHAFPATHEFAGVPAVFAKVRPSGNYSRRVRIPKGKTPKRYRISARCGGGNLGVSRRVRVLAPL